MNFINIFLYLAIIESSFGHFEFDNIKCLVRDASFMSFDYCFLKSVNRTYKYLSLKSKLYQLPIDNSKLIMRISKRNSISPFGKLSATVDGCRYLRERNNPVVNLLFNSYKDYTNINHTCPYNHDIYIEKIPIQHLNNFLKGIFPDGRYYLSTIWSTSNITRAEINVFFTKS